MLVEILLATPRLIVGKRLMLVFDGGVLALRVQWVETSWHPCSAASRSQQLVALDNLLSSMVVRSSNNSSGAAADHGSEK